MPAVGDVLDGAALLRWGRSSLAGLERHRDEINALNVFPVADSDTGTNLLSTMRAAVRAAEAVLPSPGVATGTTVNRPDAPVSAHEQAAADSAITERADPEPRATASADADMEALERATAGREIGAAGAAGGLGDESAARASAGVSARRIAGEMARGATAGARGNSGIILSQVLRGVADAVWDGPLTEQALRVALRRGATLVREALSSPVEGTMLTVLDRAAEHAADCQDRTLAGVAVAAADGAAKALGETPTQLGVLRDAGVVDAGARGLLVLLDELVVVTGGAVSARPRYVRRTPVRQAGGQSSAVSPAAPGSPDSARDARDSGPADARSGSSETLPDSASTPGAVREGTAPDRRAGHGAAGGRGALGGNGMRGGNGLPAALGGTAYPETPLPAPQYEVMFLLADSDDSRVSALRDRLATLGDSVVVVGDGAGMFSAHVHCADAGAAVEAGLAAGTLSEIRIESLVFSAHGQDGPVDRGILVVASGTGAVRLFEDAGAAVLEGEVTAESLLAGIRRMPHREVLVLPNGALPAHELVAVSVAARDGQREVLMLPSGSMVQGLAALSMHDAGLTAVDDVFAMSEAAAGTRWGALRIAPERALTIVGTCESGDGLGLVGHDVVVIDPDLRAAGRTLLDRMLGLGGELVTMLIGCDAPEGLSKELSEHIGTAFPGVEVVVYPGGQVRDLVQIGVE